MTSYFDNFAGFDEDEGAPILDEFNRLACMRGWGIKRVEKERKKCLEAGLLDLLDHDDDMSRLDILQQLCAELDIIPIPGSITQCKLMLSRKHVNVIDLIDANRAGDQVKTFHSKKALINYTQHTKRYFPKDIAKEEHVGSLLKQIW